MRPFGPDLSPAVAAHYVLGHGGFYDGPLMRPGSFYDGLVRSCFLADDENLERLRAGFPVLVAAVWRYKNEPGGADLLAVLAESV